MLKRISILMMIVLLVAALAPILPAAAQGETPTPAPSKNPAPAACTADEDTQIVTAMKDFSDQYTAAGKDAANAKTAEDFIALAIAFDKVSTYFNSTTLSQLPQCADAYILAVYTQFMLDNTILSETSAAASLTATTAGQITIWSDAATFHAGKLSDYATQFGDFLTSLASGPTVTEWFPTCTAEELNSDAMTQLANIQTVFDGTLPDVMTFLKDGKFNSDLLTTLETQVLMPWEPLSENIPQCDEAITGSGQEGALYYDSVMALSFANLADYATAKKDDATAKMLVDIESSWIVTMRNDLAARPTAQSGTGTTEATPAATPTQSSAGTTEATPTEAPTQSSAGTTETTPAEAPTPTTSSGY